MRQLSYATEATVAAACLSMIASCGLVLDLDDDVRLEEPRFSGEDDTTARSCRALHSARPDLPSGTYQIDPDGEGGAAPVMASCDMQTDGGGWTIVFVASSLDFWMPPTSYTAGTPRLMADAQQVLLAYRDATHTKYADYARFDLPYAWRAGTPFGVPSADVSMSVSISGGPLVTSTVRSGTANFASACSDPWTLSSGVGGRICIVGTLAPFYSGFANSTSDGCTDSMSAHHTTFCTHARRFSIAVR